MNTSQAPGSAQIRREFIDFFVGKCGHTFVLSSPCVPHDDPTLMFTNAGMNQFKPIFLGTADPHSEFGRLKRAVNSQKCIRAGGKHNDLDDVGHDTYHHTFFEMLGNWSFGDYFKMEAIEWAWELLTGVWGIDPNRLHATYFQGDAEEGLEADTEARDLWRRILPPERVHPGNKKDNFWEMGDTGPCGPCSEIHIDLTERGDGGPLVNAGDARVMEIWNLVFIQFNRGADGKLAPLPARHVDTGMGFERICAVIQGARTGRLGKVSNYDTDVFTPIFAAILRATGAPAYTGKLEKADAVPSADVMKDVAYRVVADHIRTLTFAITDGALPSNEGRGYVLRRILRRAVRYGRQYLNSHKPFLCEVVPAVAEAMSEAFPELRTGPDSQRPRDNVRHVANVLREEEASFIKTLDRGIALFEDAAKYAETHHHGRISGEDAFKLHDTYGFPIDLTELMAEERGLTVNIGEYERLMEEAREKARSGTKDDTIPWDQLAKALLERISESKPSECDDTPKYDPSLTCDATVLARQEAEGVCSVLVDRTCFYVEQGGQVADIGTLETNTGMMQITSVRRYGQQIQHAGVKLSGRIDQRQKCRLTVDPVRRLTMQNHTSTHILNWALREVLGEHVQQKGSLVDPDKTRFDLSHPAAISDDELTRIEKLVNDRISEGLPVYTNDNVPVAQKDAMRINGLRAVFGEKYPEKVRVVSVGVPITEEEARKHGKTEWLLKDPGNAKWRQFSVEFCGGTHVRNTSEIRRAGSLRHFILIEESAVAKGIRRVVGVTGEKAAAAERAAVELSGALSSLESEFADEPRASGRASALAEQVNELAARIDQEALPVVDRMRLRVRLAKLRDSAKQLQKQQARAGASDAAAKADELLGKAERVNGHAIITGAMGTATIDQLRAAADALRAKAGSAAVFLAAEDAAAPGKVILLAAMTPDVVEKDVRAGELIRAVAPTVGGRGGGRPDMAQGGGTDASGIAQAVKEAAMWVRVRLGE